MHSIWERFPSAMVIHGVGFNDITRNSAKWKLDELVNAPPLQTVTFERVKGRSEPTSKNFLEGPLTQAFPFW